MTLSNPLLNAHEDQRLEIRPWNELTVAALILLHMSWIVPWFYLISARILPAGEGKIFVIFSLIETSLYLVVRLGTFFHLKLRIRQGAFLVVLGLSWLGSWLALKTGPLDSTSFLTGSFGTILSDLGGRISHEMLLLIVVLFLSKLAMDMAREWNGPTTVFSSLRVSVIMLCVLGFVVGRNAEQIAVFSVYLFLGAGMVALVAARMASLERKRGGRQGAFDRRWLLAVSGLTIVLVGLASVVSSLVTGQVNRLSLALRSLLTAFLTIVSLPFTLLMYLLEPLIEALRNLTKNTKPYQVPDLNIPLNSTPVPGDNASSNGVVLATIGQVLVWAVFLFILFILVRRLGKWYASQIQAVQDERQSLLEAGGLWKMLLATLRGQYKKAVDSLTGLPHLGRRERLRAATRVRQIYADLMDLSKELGNPRPAAVTPLEFLPVIQDLLQEPAHDLDTITQAYLRVRYGVLPETIQEIQAVETAWVRVKTYAEQLLKQNSSMA